LYKERNEQKRKEYAEKIKNISPESIVYVDESGFHEYIYREYGYSPKGAKIGGEISGKKFERINIIAGYVNKKALAVQQSSEALTPVLQVLINGETRNVYTILTPTLNL
jgi:hypothetical protein